MVAPEMVAPDRESDPRVLFLCSRGNERDGIFPIGLIQAANLLTVPKAGALLVELEPHMVRDIDVVVCHLHWDFNHHYFDELVTWLRREAPNAAIVIGGYLATVHADRLIEQHGVDYCLVRDYEQPFVELIDAILERRTPAWIRENVANVVSGAGESAARYRVTPAELATLDSMTLDWFPSLQQYVQFQDALNGLGLAKWTEEQYFPALIIKGSYNRRCRYCILSNQRFSGFCTAEDFTYIDAESFVQFLDGCRGWRHVNIFGDFGELDLARVLELLDGRSYAFEITIGDIFNEPPVAQIEQLGSHFAALWLGFNIVPRSCLIARKTITLEMFEQPYVRELLALDARCDHIVTGLWVNQSNLDPDVDFSHVEHRFMSLDPWIPFPTQEPNDASFAALLAGSQRFRKANDTRRRISVAVTTTPTRTPSGQVVIEADAMTRMGQVGQEPPEFDARIRASSAAVDELGRFVFEYDTGAVAQPSTIELWVYDEKSYFRETKQYARQISIECPPLAEGYQIRLRCATNVYVVDVESAGELVYRQVVPFTTGDLSLMVPAEVLARVALDVRRKTSSAPVPRTSLVGASASPHA